MLFVTLQMFVFSCKKNKKNKKKPTAKRRGITPPEDSNKMPFIAHYSFVFLILILSIINYVLASLHLDNVESYKIEFLISLILMGVVWFFFSLYQLIFHKWIRLKYTS